MLTSPFGVANSENAGATSELESTTLTLTTGQAVAEVEIDGRVNLVSIAASALLASTN